MEALFPVIRLTAREIEIFEFRVDQKYVCQNDDNSLDKNLF